VESIAVLAQLNATPLLQILQNSYFACAGIVGSGKWML
jgi:hypothetical protein